MGNFGVVIGVDRRGDFMVRPEEGGKKVIIKDSHGKDFEYGERVEYSVNSKKELDTAIVLYDASLKKAPKTSNVLIKAKLLVPSYLLPTMSLEESVTAAVKNADLSGVAAAIFYDAGHPKEWGYMDSHNFISVAKSYDAAEDAKVLVYKMGFGGGGSRGLNDKYDDGNLFGIAHHVIKDFRVKVIVEPKQGSVLFFPVMRLTPFAGGTGISYPLEVSSNDVKQIIELLPENFLN